MDDTDLSLVATDDLLDELIARHDAIIFGGIQNRTTDSYYYIRRWSGGNILCLGLARFIQKRIEEKCDQMDRIEEADDRNDND